MSKDPHQLNRLSWNAATVRHNLHKGDQAKFHREGGSTLFPEEVELLGDIEGKQFLHLQCNCGQDTLSIASQLGAVVTGVDISDEAVSFANELSQESGIAAEFHRADIFDWCENPDVPRFDVVFSSYGATCWLSDLERWGQCVANVLKPGGKFVFVEFHPLALMFDEDGGWRLKYDYMGGAAIHEPEGVSDYVGEACAQPQSLDANKPADAPTDPFENPHPSVGYAWGVSDHVSALLNAGLRIDSLTEYPYSNAWKPYPEVVETEDRRMVMPEGMPVIPLMFSLVARKSG